ncbi:MAG TPA: DUF547 domain-containing protein [Planctomycetaceae bacterium]|nr:DUF547 domain-containing protein [Planctomycetaceae bacterium]
MSIDDIDHRVWDNLLKRYVDDEGNVAYSEWKSTPADVELLDAYLAALSRADPARDASRPARLAFWVNAYNALTIRGILREYPTDSIQNHAARLWGFNIWRDLLLTVGDAAYSLGQIEHDVLRPLHEPRIHFAIVCASRGCPRLLNRAYTAWEIERQLLDNTRNFFADGQKLQFDAATGQLRVSPILKWYAGDFGESETQRLQMIAPFLPEGISRQIPGGILGIAYLDYDWSLNDQSTPNFAAMLPPDSGPTEGGGAVKEPR